MGGVKKIDIRAHGTQKLRQSHVLTQNKNTSTWPEKTESLAMCKTEHEHAANKETHKPHVQTKHDKHESIQLVKNISCVPHRTRQHKRKQKPKRALKRKTTMQTHRGAHGPSELETACSHSKTKHETEHVDKRARGSSTLEAALTSKQDKKGVSEFCHKSMNKLDRSDRTLTAMVDQRS